MAIHKWNDLKRERISGERLTEIEAQVEQEDLEMDFAAGRGSAGDSAAELRERIAVGLEQADRSKLRDGEEVFRELEARLRG